VSRGAGNLGLDPRNCAKASVVVIAEPLSIYPKELYETGLEIVTVATRRNRSDVLSPMVKSLNYLNNILVKIEANLAGAPEALMLNDQGYVAEGSADNIFIVKDNKLYTDRKSTRLNSSHVKISYAVFCLKKKNTYRLR